MIIRLTLMIIKHLVVYSTLAMEISPSSGSPNLPLFLRGSIDAYMHAYIYIHTCIYIYIYVHIHAYIQTDRQTLHYITLHCTTLQYHCITLHITLHNITLRKITLHCITLPDITSHCTTIHYTPLHYVTLHNIHTYVHPYICVVSSHGTSHAQIRPSRGAR